MTRKNTNGAAELPGQSHLFGDLREMLKGKAGDDGAARKAVEDIRDAFPLVADILGGIAGGKGQPEILPGTITFFVKDGVARFSINVKSAEMSFIGDLADVADPWNSVEIAMKTGKVSSKRYTEQKPSLTETEKTAIPY